MTLYYVDAARADNTGDGLGTATAKKTIQAAENLSPAAGSIIHVRTGTYRETLTLGVSGTAGNPIEIRGDYTGVIWGDAGGSVRITGSDNDQTATRGNCIFATAKAYRTFKGLCCDLSTGNQMQFATSSDNMIVQNCILAYCNGNSLINFAAAPTNNLVDGCQFYPGSSDGAVTLISAATTNNTANIVSNCVFIGGATGVSIARVGGITVKNCTFPHKGVDPVIVSIALAVGQVTTVNNCIFTGGVRAVKGTAVTDITENYNTFFGNQTDRTNTNTGANSITYPPLFDTRWFFQLALSGAGPNSPLQVLSPFDLASYSQLVNLAGTSPTTTDLRGTAVQGAQREWGALEADTTLKIFGGVKKSRLDAGH